MHLYDADRGGQISTLRRARSSISATPRGLQRTIEQHRVDYAGKNGLQPPNAIEMDTQDRDLLILAGGKRAISAADILIVETWLYRSYGS